MTPEILLVLGILIVVIVVLVTEIIPSEAFALPVLGTLTITGLVTPADALAGFGNPAVVTNWAVFIVSGGLTTMIGTPPNILVNEPLRTNNLTPVGLIVMTSGIAFFTLIGSRLLPASTIEKRDKAGGDTALSQYKIIERLFSITVPSGSSLVGQTLAFSHLGSHLGLNAVGIIRKGRKILAPSGSERIAALDQLMVEGRIDRIVESNNWGQFLAESDTKTGPRQLQSDMTLPAYRLDFQLLTILREDGPGILPEPSSFTSPISHPANVLVMGPGGYRFIDCIKLGVPLTLVILAILMIFITLFWSF